MQTYHIETVISDEGVLNIMGLPLHKGEVVEVVVKSHSQPKDTKNSHPLWGTPVYYERPFDGVAENEWDAIK